MILKLHSVDDDHPIPGSWIPVQGRKCIGSGGNSNANEPQQCPPNWINLDCQAETSKSGSTKYQTRRPSDEEWQTFEADWKRFKRLMQIPDRDLADQLIECCEKPLSRLLQKENPANLKHKGAIVTSSSQLWFYRLSLPSGPLYGDFFW